MLPALLLLAAGSSWAVPPDRVFTAIDNSQTVVLQDHVNPRAQSQYDQGPVEASFKMGYITMMFKPSAEQQADLTQFLAEQQDPHSPNYHQWLTPEQYANRFGMSAADIHKITSWLRSEGFGIVQVARGHDWIAFRGTAAQVQSTFRTEIHRYKVDGEMHFANASNPSIPKALVDVVLAFRGLDDFGPKPLGVKKLAPGAMLQRDTMHSFYTVGGSHYLAPDDLATIYDITPLYTANYNGKGQKLVIVGQTDIATTDIDTFRSMFNLIKNDPTQILVTGCVDPGTTSDQLEADLDLEWSGAVARSATIVFVKCDANHGGVNTSAQYTIDQDLAPVISMSYGLCEAQTPLSFISANEAELLKANSEGITFFASSGDTGAAGCDYGNNVASHGLAVNYPASSPEVTGVGGNEFNEGGGTYWNTSNNGNGESAISYIPETAWNDSAADHTLEASGGGASSCAITGCKGFPKPSWQTGVGVPNDGVRDVPDIALTASADHDGYILCSAGSCTGNSFDIVGGTSASSPVFAGIVTLQNQYLGNKQGNINPALYQTVVSNPTAFHDVTTGNNIVPCTNPSPNCPTMPPYQFGYSAGVGYDQVTGWGSVDACNFVTGTNGSSGKTPTVTVLTVVPAGVNYQANVSVTLTATVKHVCGGSGTPTGTVTFFNGTTQVGTPQTLSNGTATFSYSTSALPAAIYQMTADYSGDTNFNSSNSSAVALDVEDFSFAANPTTVTVSSPGLSGETTLTITPLGGFNQTLSFTCSPLPSETTCTATKNSNTSYTMTFNTMAASELRDPFGRSRRIFYALLLPGLMGLVVPVRKRKRTLRNALLLCLFAVLAGSILWMVACGGGSSGNSNPGTPTGTTQVTITAATSGSNPLSHTAQITLNVQ
jgi:subtilase family serine protease